MPTYLFKCKNGHSFEYLMSIKEYEEEKDKKICPICKSKLERVYTAIPFKLEGMGWAEDGYQITEMEMQSNRDSDQFASEKLEKQTKM